MKFEQAKEVVFQSPAKQRQLQVFVESGMDIEQSMLAAAGHDQLETVSGHDKDRDFSKDVEKIDWKNVKM